MERVEQLTEATIANGCACVPAGEWLVGRAQPAACDGVCTVRTLKGFVVPDRGCVQTAEAHGSLWCAAQERPFLTRLDALPDAPLAVASAKVLVAPRAARTGARNVKLVPMSFRRATHVTEFRLGWVITATRSRVTRVALENGETLMVRPEALVAWIGKDPSGHCPKLGLWDMLLPRGPKNLLFSFHGPATVWFEGSREPALARRQGGGGIL